jgi:hypothetical protein
MPTPSCCDRLTLRVVLLKVSPPPQECGGPRGYMRILDQHKYYPPVTEQELVEKALQRIAGVLPDQGHRDSLKELQPAGG